MSAWRTLRVVWRMTALNVMMTLEYRGAFLIYMFNTVAGPTISLLVWLAVSAAGAQLPYGRSQLVTYYVLLSVTAMLTATWTGWFIGENIRLGDLSSHLMRPAPYILGMIGNNIGEKIIKLPLLLPLVGVVALAFRHDLRPPTDPLAWALFLLCLPLAAAVAFLFDVTIGSLAFWIDEVNALLRGQAMLAAFLAGQYVPLALFPPGAARWLELQPFRYTLSFPLEILTGALDGPALARGFAFQIAYCALFWALYRLVWHFGLRSYSAVGA